MRGILTLGLLFLGVYAISGKATEAILNSALVKIKSLSLDAGATVLDIVQGYKPLILSVEVTNTESVGTTINSFSGSAIMNNMAVADLFIELNVKLKPGEAVTIDIPILLDSAAVLTAGADAIQQKTIPPVIIEGVLTANSFTYPVNETFEFSI